MPYVYSTATSSIRYSEYKTAKDVNTIVRSVTIAGGANVANKHLITPLGVATRVTDDELEFLMKDLSFKKHLERGFMKIEKTKKDPEVVVAKGMELRDASAPETPETLAAKGVKVKKEKKLK